MQYLRLIHARNFIIAFSLACTAIAPPVWAQDTEQSETSCPPSALSRFTRHTIQSGETIESIAADYNLLSTTLMGLNPALQTGTAPVGTEIIVPPYNGIRVEVASGTTWRDLAAQYSVRPDVLFELNGCETVPDVVFVPGVNWSPNGAIPAEAESDSPLTGYPLSETVDLLTGYGWQVEDTTAAVVFHSGVDLDAPAGTPVLAVGAGTVAFASEQSSYGNLVVINHSQGLQTRYAQLDTIAVEVGQTVQPGEQIGTVGMTGNASVPHLHFEVRSNSDLGWVAEDPSLYIPYVNLSRRTSSSEN